MESVVKEADMASHLFVCRLRDLWGTIQGHSWYYGVKDTLCISELLRVPKFYCHPGKCFVLMLSVHQKIPVCVLDILHVKKT